jgi:hypothetical protein
MATVIRGVQGPLDLGGSVHQLEGKLPFKSWGMSRTWALELGFWAAQMGWLQAGAREDKGRSHEENRTSRTERNPNSYSQK